MPSKDMCQLRENQVLINTSYKYQEVKASVAAYCSCSFLKTEASQFPSLILVGFGSCNTHTEKFNETAKEECLQLQAM